MRTANVLFLANAGNDVAGERKRIDAKRAQRLVRTGYVQLLDDDVPETAVVAPDENATTPRPQARGPRPERRG